MFRLVLDLINRMLLFVALFILVLGGINSIFGTNLGLKIGGDRLELPEEFIGVLAISIILLLLAGLLNLGLHFKKVVGWIKAEPLKVGGGILVGLVVLSVVGYFGIMQLAGGQLSFAVERSDYQGVQKALATDTYDQETLDDQLYQAVANGDYDIALALIEYGADVNHTFGDFESPLLHAAVLWHEVGATDFLLQQGADPNQLDNMGRSPLVEAVLYRASAYSDGALNEATHIVIALLVAGGDPSIAADNGDTPLSIAESNSYENIISHLTQ
jgi:hypothetical protein